ncbi:MAG: winged helix-turn-helix transcriptional regulator [Deltaproteobacteria bacterium]|nr:winged helix-turn-helix transcriptional regulator [Deltaproteobacteria bacterium]
MKNMVNAFKAMADQNRLKILKMLQCREMCVCEIRTLLEVSQPSASKHLRVLEKAGLINSYKEGLFVNYRISRPNENRQIEELLANLSRWLETDDDITNIMERLPNIHREDICGRQ